MKIRLRAGAEDGVGVMAPHVTQIAVLSSPISLASRLSLDPTHGRLGVVDGGWWPRSRDASVELPLLVSSLNARVGAVLRLGVDARDWDEIPRRITVGGHLVRVGRFADVNHKIIVTLGSRDHILLLVIPPQASAAAAKSALAMAATGKTSGRPEEILAASGVENQIRANAHRPVTDVGDPRHERERRFEDAEGVPPMVIEDVLRDEHREGDGRGDIGRWLDDGAPSPEFPRPR
jgi:Family of unknown function (DUF5994)